MPCDLGERTSGSMIAIGHVSQKTRDPDGKMGNIKQALEFIYFLVAICGKHRVDMRLAIRMLFTELQKRDMSETRSR